MWVFVSTWFLTQFIFSPPLRVPSAWGYGTRSVPATLITWRTNHEEIAL